ncbi:MAG: HisA/HisF-related TIM barrel protein [Thermodesulfobacteriota bacterium]
MTKPQERIISPIVISTALGHDGRGIFPYTVLPGYRRLVKAVRETGTTIFTKSATRFLRRGNFIPANPLTWKYIRRLPDMGMLNAYGLTNDGAEACAQDIRQAGDLGFNVIPNIYPEFIKGTDTAIRETLEAVAIFRHILGDHFKALELNYSCPNSEEAVARNVVQAIQCTREVRSLYPGLFLVAKLSVCHPYEFAQELERLGVNALHAVNTVAYNIVFPLQRSPLNEVGGGGVSGGPAFDLAYKYNQELRPKVGVFLIMGCGVRSLDDVRRYFDLGADAVSLCTLALRKPREAARVVVTYNSREAVKGTK